MSKRLCFGFAVLEISFWCFHASFIGFASAYLLHRGISNTMLSLLVAIFLFCAFLGSFFWGGLCDKFQTNRNLIVILFLIGLAIAPLNNLKIIILENVGGNVSDIGIDSFIGAMTQVPLLALAGKTHKIPQRIRYLLMSILPLCMLLLTFFAVSPVMIFAGSCLNNIAYGILLPTMRDVTERNVEYRLRNLGHSLAEAVYTSLSGMMSLLYAGAIVDHLGVHAMLSVCIVIMGIPVIMSCLHREKIILN